MPRKKNINPGKQKKNYTAKLEKTIASEIINNEVNIENDVNKKLNGIIEHQIQVIQKQKRIVAKCHQDNEAARQKHQVRISLTQHLLIVFNSFQTPLSVGLILLRRKDKKKKAKT